MRIRLLLSKLMRIKRRLMKLTLIKLTLIEPMLIKLVYSTLSRGTIIRLIPTPSLIVFPSFFSLLLRLYLTWGKETLPVERTGTAGRATLRVAPYAYRKERAWASTPSSSIRPGMAWEVRTHRIHCVQVYRKGTAVQA